MLFSGLESIFMFVVYPEHVSIIVAYYLRLLFECSDFRGDNFPFWGSLYNENNPTIFLSVRYIIAWDSYTPVFSFSTYDSIN